MSASSDRRRREELVAVATKAAVEARAKERQRCLDLLEHILQHTARALGEKLMSEAQTQLAQLRLRITEAVVREIKGLVFAGIDPRGMNRDNPPASTPGRPDAIRPREGQADEGSDPSAPGLAASPAVDP